jgi:arginine transport system ATP-binding protein
MSIKLNGINCFYGAHQALFDITLNCPEGETLVLLGPSGAGKSSFCASLICLKCLVQVRWQLPVTILISRKPV